MKKVRKNYAMRISSILLILTMMSLCMVSGTFAKYTVTTNASDTATVAKFAVKLGENELTKADTITVNLFKSTYLDGKVKGKSEGETEKKVVAPGTSGYIPITISNEGEVAVTARLTFEESQTGDIKIPIKYGICGSENATDVTDWKTTIRDLNDSAAQSLAVDESGAPRYLHWKWDTENDTKDTELGTAETLAQVTTTITCNVEQDITKNS